MLFICQMISGEKEIPIPLQESQSGQMSQQKHGVLNNILYIYDLMYNGDLYTYMHVYIYIYMHI